MPFYIVFFLQYETAIDFLRDKCSWTIFRSELGIIPVDGGAGNGKTHMLAEFLGRIIRDEFDLARSILVCGVSESSINRLSNDISKTYNVGIRYKTNSDQNIRQKINKHKIVFTTLDSAIDLIS